MADAVFESQPRSDVPELIDSDLLLLSPLSFRALFPLLASRLSSRGDLSIRFSCRGCALSACFAPFSLSSVSLFFSSASLSDVTSSICRAGRSACGVGSTFFLVRPRSVLLWLWSAAVFSLLSLCRWFPFPFPPFPFPCWLHSHPGIMALLIAALLAIAVPCITDWKASACAICCRCASVTCWCCQCLGSCVCLCCRGRFLHLVTQWPSLFGSHSLQMRQSLA